MFKFIHCADLHLGATFKRLTAKCDAMLKKIIADSSFESWSKLIAKAIAEKVDFVIISGDIFDSAKPMLRSRMIFKHGVNELIQAGIKVFIVNGNHDDKLTIFNEFSFGEQVKVFSADKVEVCELPELKVAVAGISYDNDNARENLSLAFKNLNFPEDYFKIAVLHANIGGVKNLADEESGCYSNCQLSDLTMQKFDYWALGHIHNGGVLHKEKPLVVYPGSLQGLNINQDTPKGAYLVAVNSNHEAELTFFECGELGFCRKEIDLSEVANDYDFIEKITVLRDDLLKVYKNNKLIFTELIFTGRSKFYSKLRSESELELLQSVQFMLGDKFFLNNLNLLVAPVIDNEKLLRNNPLLSDILSVDDTGELGKSFLSDKIRHLRNKFPLLDSYSDSDIEKMIDYSKNELFKLFAENEGDLS